MESQSPAPSFFRQPVSAVMVLGMLAGVAVGLRFDLHKPRDAQPVRSGDLQAPPGYGPAPAPDGVGPSLIVGCWQSGGGSDAESVLIVRGRGELVDGKLLERMKKDELARWARYDPRLLRATFLGRHRQDVAIVELSVGQGSARRRLRHAVVGGSNHATSIEQLGPEERSLESSRVFEGLVDRVADVMSRDPPLWPWTSGLFRGAIIGALCGAALERVRRRMRAKAAAQT